MVKEAKEQFSVNLWSHQQRLVGILRAISHASKMAVVSAA
jgi:hypothetical protein